MAGLQGSFTSLSLGANSFLGQRLTPSLHLPLVRISLIFSACSSTSFLETLDGKQILEIDDLMCQRMRINWIRSYNIRNELFLLNPRWQIWSASGISCVTPLWNGLFWVSTITNSIVYKQLKCYRQTEPVLSCLNVENEMLKELNWGIALQYTSFYSVVNL